MRSLAIRGSLGHGKGTLLRQALRDPDVGRLYPDGALWLDGSTPLPWLLATLPTPLLDLMRAPHSYQRLGERLSRAQALLVVRNGGAHERLREDAVELMQSEGLRIVWIEDEATSVQTDAQFELLGLPNPATGDDAALALVASTLGRPIEPNDQARWYELIAQVEGSPLALRLLAGAERASGSPHGRQLDGSITLAEVVRHLVLELPTEAQRAIDVLLLSREPVAFSAAQKLTQLSERSLRGLVARGWLRQTRVGDVWVPSALRRLVPLTSVGSISLAEKFEPWLQLIDTGLDRGLEVGFTSSSLPPAAMAIFWSAAMHHGALPAWLERRERINHWASQSGRLGLLHAWSEALLHSHAVRASASSQARLHFSLAMALSDPPNLDRAVVHLEAGLRLSQDDEKLQSSGQETLGTLQLQLGAYEKAAEAYRSSLNVATRQGRSALWRSNLDANLAFIELLMGHTQGLETRLRTAIQAKVAERRVGSALPHMNALGLLYLAQERFDEAIEVLVSAHQQNARLHDQSFSVYLLHALATTQLEQGNLMEAHRTCLLALEAAVPHLHTAVVAMIHSTRLRIAIRSTPAAVTASDLNRHLDAYTSVPQHLRRYATITAAMYHAEVLGERHRAASWLKLLLDEPLEAHLATIARRLLQRTVGHGEASLLQAPYASSVELWPDLYIAPNSEFPFGVDPQGKRP